MVNFDRLEGLIKEQGRTKAFLCDKAGKRRNYISDAKAGNGSISDEALEVFARELGTTVAYLQGETDDRGQKETPALPMEDEQINPDIRMIARAGRKMSPEQAENLRKYAQYMFPEAFKDDDT